MKKTFIAGILLSALLAGSPLFAQTQTDEITQLKERVAQLEKQVQEISKLVEPLKAQQATEKRQKALRKNFDKKMAADRAKYTPAQLDEAEGLYQVANKNWGSPEAMTSLKTMVEKYPDINRTGCAMLYLAQKSAGADRTKYLRDCIEKYGDCFYGDGVQVGAFARYLLAQDYRTGGDEKKAEALVTELKTKFPDAVDHGGNLLADELKGETK